MREYQSASPNGVPIAYLRDGSGPPVLLLHGFGSNAQTNWGRTGWLGMLAEAGLDGVAPDLRGHGQSAKSYDPADYRLPLLAADILGLLDQLGLGRSSIVGYSMGARVAAWMAVHRPERVGSLVLGGVGLRIVEGSADARLIADAVEAEDPGTLAPVLGPVFRRYAEWTGSDLKALAASMRGQIDTIPAADLRSISPRTLVIAGERDDLARGAPELAALIPGAAFLSVTGQDHMRAVGHPAFKRAVMDFLRRGT